jgi:hypothetical protein
LRANGINRLRARCKTFAAVRQDAMAD